MKNTNASHNGMPDLKSLQSPWGDKNNTNNIRLDYKLSAYRAEKSR